MSTSCCFAPSLYGLNVSTFWQFPCFLWNCCLETRATSRTSPTYWRVLKQEDLFPLPGMFCELPTIAIPLSVVIGHDCETSSDCTMAVSCFCGSWWLPVVAKWLGWNWSKFLLNNNPQCLFLVGGMFKKGGGWSV